MRANLATREGKLVVPDISLPSIGVERYFVQHPFARAAMKTGSWQEESVIEKLLRPNENELPRNCKNIGYNNAR